MTSRTPHFLQSREEAIDGWFRELNFYETEIKCCELSLEEMITQPLSRSALIQLEHFQNQFIHQRTVINDLKFQLRRISASLSAFQRTEVDLHSFRKNFNELLREFDEFVQQWLD